MRANETGKVRLCEILLKPVLANGRALRCRHALDNQVERDLPGFDIAHGLWRSRGVALPHETVADYWERSFAERCHGLSEDAAGVHRESSGRNSTPRLLVAAFCWWSPLCRYHGDERLLEFFANGLDFFTRTGGRTGAGLAKIRTVDVVLPTRTGVTIRKRCVTRPTDHQGILLQRLGLHLPTHTRLTKM